MLRKRINDKRVAPVAVRAGIGIGTWCASGAAAPRPCARRPTPLRPPQARRVQGHDAPPFLHIFKTFDDFGLRFDST
jgi:hypothetical protein